MPGERDRGEPQAGDPPLGALVKQGNALVRERDVARLEELPGLVERKAQVVGPDLGKLAREAQAMQTELRLLAGSSNT